MPKLKFYDLAERKSFLTDKFKIMSKNGRKFAVAISPYTGNKAFRILGKA